MNRSSIRSARRGLFLIALTLACAACGARDEEQQKAATLTEAQQRTVLDAEIRRREKEIGAEIAKLGPQHRWAGKYYEGDGLGENVELTLAPDAGCLATWRGCMGLYGANWGKVIEKGDKLLLVFERPNTPGEFGFFDEELEIDGRDANRFLKPPNGREVLRLVP